MSTAVTEGIVLPRAGEAGAARSVWPFMAGAAVIAAAVVAVAAWMQPVPNPDALYYLTAAEHFAQGQWHEGFTVYRWPFYSLQIAGVMAFAGLDALPAAVVADIAYSAGLAAVFVYLIGQLSGRDRPSLLIAVLVIGFNARLAHWAPAVVRDHGYWFFLLAAITTAVSDRQRPALAKKLLLVAEIVLATLFRIEGAFLFIVVPGFIAWSKTRSTLARLLISAAVACLSLAGVLGFALWNGGGWAGFHQFDNLIAHRVAVLNASLIDPFYADGRIWYVGMAVATLLAAMLRAYTHVFAILGLAAFFPRRLMPREAAGVFFWFALGQLPSLAIFATLQLFLPWRYAIGMALVGTIPIVFVLRAGWQEWKEGRRRAYALLPLCVLLLAASFLGDVPRPNGLGYLREAGEWIRANAAHNDYVWMREQRILYYSGRTDGLSAAEPVNERQPELGRPKSWFVIVRAPSEPLPGWLRRLPGLQLIRRFPGEDGNAAEIYARCPQSRLCTDAEPQGGSRPDAGVK